MTPLGLERASILSFVLLGGCPTNEGGNGMTVGASGSSSSSGGGGTTVADGTASTAIGTDASSGDPTAGSSTGGSDTGTDDGTTTTTTDPPPESTGDSETSGSAPGEGEPYGPCGAGSSCNAADSFCYENAGRDMCLPTCDGTSPSCPPAPPDNGSLVECIEVPLPADPHCMLNCAGGAACPEGTMCVDLGGGIFRCLWP